MATAKRKPAPRKQARKGLNLQQLEESQLFWIFGAAGILGSFGLLFTIYRNQFSLEHEMLFAAGVNGATVFMVVISLAFLGKLVPHLKWMVMPLVWVIETWLRRDLTKDKIVGKPKRVPTQPEIIDAEFVEVDAPIKELGLDIPRSQVVAAFQQIVRTRRVSHRSLSVAVSHLDSAKLFSRMEQMGLIAPKKPNARSQGFVVTDKGWKFINKVLASHSTGAV